MLCFSWVILVLVFISIIVRERYFLIENQVSNESNCSVQFSRFAPNGAGSLLKKA